MDQSANIIQAFVGQFYRDRQELEQIRVWMDKKLRELLSQNARICGNYTLNSRVKNQDPLEIKLQDRARKHGPYRSLGDIYADVKDLVALRITLPSYIQQLVVVQDTVRHNFDWAGETPIQSKMPRASGTLHTISKLW
jgi:ppGpp synthetase/RelA/SpoT-type nucleotidyltranferase